MKKILMVLILMVAACSVLEEQKFNSNFSITPLNDSWNYNLRKEGFSFSNDKIRAYFDIDALDREYDKRYCVESPMLEHKLYVRMRGTGKYDSNYIFNIAEAYTVKSGEKKKMFIEIPPNSTGKEKIRPLENKNFRYEYFYSCDRLDGLEFLFDDIYDEYNDRKLPPIHFRVNYVKPRNPQKSEFGKFMK